MSAMTAMQGDAPAPDQSQSGYSIEINVDAQGGISVGVDNSTEEPSEQMRGGMTPDAMAADGAMPAQSIDEAIKMVMAIYQNNGDMPAPQSEDDAFASGYGKPKPPPPKMGMSVNKVFGDE